MTVPTKKPDGFCRELQ